MRTVAVLLVMTGVARADGIDWWNAEAGRYAARGDALGAKAAIACHRQALGLETRLGDRKRRAATLLALAPLLEDAEDVPGFRGAAEESLALFRALGDEAGAMRALDQVGTAAIYRGDLDFAVKTLGESAAAAQRLGLPLDEAKALVDQANAALAGDRATFAIPLLERAVRLLQPYPERARSLAGAENSLGGAYRRLGDGEHALAHYRRSTELREAHGLPPSFVTLTNIAYTYYEIFDAPAPAIEAFHRGLRLAAEAGDRRDAAWAAAGIGSSYLLLDQPALALASLLPALDAFRTLDDPRGKSGVLHSVGFADLRLHRPELARAAFEESLALGKKLGNEGYQSLALEGLARSERALGHLAEARATLDQALALREKLRADVGGAALRASYFVTSRRTYDLDVDVLLELGETDAALAASERARARTLLDALANAGAKAELPPADTAATRAALDADTTLVEYSLGEERSFAFTVTADQVRAHVLAPRARIEAAARAAVTLLGARNARPAHEPAAARAARVAAADATLPAALRTLSELVLAPLAAEIGTSRLALVADGALAYVPFAALPLDGAPLLAHHEIAYLPSASVLPALRAHRRGGAPKDVIAVLADPVFSADDERVTGHGAAKPGPPLALLTRAAADSGLADLPRLHFSRAEAQAIGGLVPPDRAAVALDFAASRAAVLGPVVAGARVVHFATHGLVDSVHPTLSGLVLSLVDAGGAPRPGFLGLADIYRLDLRAELVVLSACQTALGAYVSGEGIVGLTRGFMYAGVPRVVASLWEVNDRATAELMKRFYSALLGEHLPAAAALRQAQLGLAAENGWRAPYFWAAFTLHGDWR